MSERDDFRGAAARLLDNEDVEGVLSGAFYSAPPPSRVARKPEKEAPKEKPDHYKVICISMYTEDLKRLDEMIDTLKARGLTKANRSALIRWALSAIDLTQVPRGL